MFHLFEFIQSLDPATAEFLWTACVSTLLVLSTAISIWVLPWSDEEIARVDTADCAKLLRAFSWRSLCAFGSLR